jgi:hypothetical protein
MSWRSFVGKIAALIWITLAAIDADLARLKAVLRGGARC